MPRFHTGAEVAAPGLESIQAGPGGPAVSIVDFGILWPVKGTLRDSAALRSSFAVGDP
jgi:hypothetical protein